MVSRDSTRHPRWGQLGLYLLFMGDGRIGQKFRFGPKYFVSNEVLFRFPTREQIFLVEAGISGRVSRLQQI
jgi:hypothetical protein